MSSISRGTKMRIVAGATLSTITVYVDILLMLSYARKEETTWLSLIAAFVGVKTLINLFAIKLEDNSDRPVFYFFIVLFQLHYIVDAYRSLKKEHRSDSLQVGKFLLLAFESIPQALLQMYITMDEEDITTYRTTSIILSICTISLAVSEMEQAPVYEGGWRHTLYLAYRIPEVTVFVFMVSVFASEFGAYVFLALFCKYIILVAFSIYNHLEEWYESKAVETLAALFFCLSDVSIVLWTSKMSGLQDPIQRGHYFFVYRASTKSFVRAMLLQDFFTAIFVSVVFGLSGGMDEDFRMVVGIPLVACFLLQHLAVFVGIKTHPQSHEFDDEVQEPYIAFHETVN